MLRYIPIIGLVLILIAAPASAGPGDCFPHDQIVSDFAKQSGSLAHRGLTKTDGGSYLTEVFTSSQGRWAVVVTRAGGASCIMATGGEWEDVPRQPTEQEEPSL